MLIGLIADTHIPDIEQNLPPEVIEAFRGVDLILHAGDIYIPSVLDDLQRISPVIAAQGDDDGDMYPDERVKDKHVLKLEGKVLWLVHDRAYHLFSPVTPLWRNKIIPGSSKYETPDIIVFGHEHRTIVQQNDGILFVNPGSPTFLNYQRGLGTIGLLDIGPDGADVRIVQL